jgi:signal transduction histidine kinase
VSEAERAASSKLRSFELAGAERRVLRALEDEPRERSRTRAALVVALAALMFAGAFALRLVIDDPDALVANFYAVPIALLAAEFGVRGGMAAAAVAFALVPAWGVINSIDINWLGYTSRAAVFVMVGGLVGIYAERVERDVVSRRRGLRELELRAEELGRSNAYLRQAVARLEAFAEIARSVGGETDLGRVLGLILDRARGVVGARALLICLREGDGLRVAATTGPGRDRSLAVDSGPIATALTGAGALRLAAPDGASLTLAPGLEARAAVLVPLDFRGERLGILAALDRLEDGPQFDPEDEELMTVLAASAATAVATAQSVAHDRLRHSIEAAEQARGRWARELHDETLQGLVGLRMLLSSARRSGSPEEMAAAIAEATDETKHEIRNLRALIAELRPAALDELGLGPAIETLAERSTAGSGMEVQTRLALGGDDGRLAPETESAVYRVVQEALTNVVKHAQACHVRVEVTRVNGSVDVLVEDDGRGFDPVSCGDGLGLVGMRERVELTGGRLEISSRPGGSTQVRAQLPAAPRATVG